MLLLSVGSGIVACAPALLGNGHLEIGRDFPAGFTTWNRENTQGEVRWELGHDHTTGRGRSVGLSIHRVDDETEGALSVLTTKERILPGALYGFTAYVKVEGTDLRPQLGIRWKYKERTAGGEVLWRWNERSSAVVEAKPQGSLWTEVTVRAIAPNAEADAAVLFLTAVTSASKPKGRIWFDDLDLAEFPKFHWLRLSANKKAYLSPAVATLVTFSAEVLKNRGSDSGELILDLPEGVKVVGMARGALAALKREQIRRGKESFTRHVIRYPHLQSYYAFETVFLETNLPIGSVVPMFATLTATGSRTSDEQQVDLEVIDIPKVPQLERLRTGVLDWIRVDTAMRWPIFDVLSRIGVRSAGHTASIEPPSLGSELRAFHERADRGGFEVHATMTPFYSDPSRLRFEEHELARDRDGKTYPYMCLASREGSFQQELAWMRRAGQLGIRWLAFDYEAPKDLIFCGNAVDRFRTAYPEFSDQDPRGFRRDGVYDARDAAFDAFQASLGTEMWTEVHRAVREGLRSIGSTDPPVLAQWNALPGMIYEGHTDFDALYPQVFSAATPIIYPQLSGFSLRDVGPTVRRTLLGVLALTAPNEIEDGGFEEGVGTLPSSLHAIGDGVGWDNLNKEDGRAAHGKRAIRISARQGRIVYRFQRVAPGEVYLFGISARREGGSAKPCIEVIWRIEGKRSPLRGPRDCGPNRRQEWRRISILARAPVLARTPGRPAAAEVHLFSVGETGTSWFDDLRVVRPNRVQNGSFELARNGWPVGFERETTHNSSAKIRWGREASHGSRSLEFAFGQGETAAVEMEISHVFPDVYYQFSVMGRSETKDANIKLQFAWFNGEGRIVTTSSASFGQLFDSEWSQQTISVLSPEGASAVRIRIEARGSAGKLWLDEADFRVDGPYVIPWMTAGWNGNEMEPREVFEQILESYLAGAQALLSYPYSGFDGADLRAIAWTSRMLKPIEGILADGRPLLDDELSIHGEARLHGMEYGGDAALLLSAYDGARRKVEIVYRTKWPGHFERIDADGRIERIASYGPCRATERSASGCARVFRTYVDPSDPAPRVKLFRYQRDRAR